MGRNRVLFRLGADDVSAIRFGVSPGLELALAVRVLVSPGGHPLQWGWVRMVRAQVAPPVLDLFAALVGTASYLPDFLTTSPEWDTTPDDEVDRLRGIPVELFSRDVAHALTEPTTWTGPDATRRRATLRRLLDDPLAGRAEVAAGWTHLWDTAFGEYWNQLERVLRADTALRTRRVAEVGLAAMVGELHDRVTWQSGAVRVEMDSFSATVDCAGSGLVLVPTVMGVPRCTVLTDEALQPTIFYPAHGITERWHQARPASSAALGGVLGEGRARVLGCLDGPLSTTEVGEVCALAVSTASFHLSRLRSAGLVESRRAGSRMLHVRSPIGEALASGPRQA